METRVDSMKFEEYAQMFATRVETLASKLEDLKRILQNLEWDDNFYESVRNAINTHINTMNAAIFSLDGCAHALSHMTKDQIRYLAFADV